MTDIAILHENETYHVTAHKNNFSTGGKNYSFVEERAFYNEGYLVTNKVTGIVEHTSISLPEAIFTSEQMNDTLLSNPWKWFSVRRKAKEEGKIIDENEAYLESLEKQAARNKRPAAASEELIK